LKKIIFLSLLSVVFCSYSICAKVGGGDINFKTSYGPAIFSHEKHAEKGLSCQQCHPDPYVTTEQHKIVSMKEMEKGLSCGLCHDGKRAFTVKANCNTCHKK
jgi:c(7)-type cytochrome triheme protein